MSFKSGDWVFARNANPAVGIVRRVSQKNGWADVQWFEGSGCRVDRALRSKAENLEKINAVLNW